MKIITTDITDKIPAKNTDAAKLLIINQVVEHFLPLFREEIEKMERVIVSHESDRKKLKSEIERTKTELIKYNKVLIREKQISTVLEEVGYLLSHDILYGENKRVVLEVLDQIDSMDSKTLEGKTKALKALAYKNIKNLKVRANN